jgi:hypothetical protein
MFASAAQDSVSIHNSPVTQYAPATLLDIKDNATRFWVWQQARSSITTRMPHELGFHRTVIGRSVQGHSVFDGQLKPQPQMHCRGDRRSPLQSPDAEN